MRFHRILIAMLVICGAARTLCAQEVPPLILEDSKEFKATTRKKDEPVANRTQDSAVPTPNPETTVVAFADGRILTRAELDMRVANEFERVRADVQSRIGGVISSNGASAVEGAAEESREVLAEQQEQIDEGMRKEENNAVQTWVEHAMLAEEARRQGVAISETEFKRRLEEAESQNQLKAEQVETALAKLQLSRADYERGVYDALMIEQLLDRFIEMNYTDDDFKKAYESAPGLYYTPEKFLIAHFSISLDGSESKAQLNSLRDLAGDVRDKLHKGADPQKLFEDPKYDRISQGIFGSVPGYYTLDEGALPKIVEYEAKKLKVGETSDVLTAQRRDDGKIVPISYHVVKILKSIPEEGKTFESAKPGIHRAMLDIARGQMLTLIRAAKTHDVVTNLGGIASAKLPGRDELIKMQKDAEPISLKFDRSVPLVDEKDQIAEETTTKKPNIRDEKKAPITGKRSGRKSRVLNIDARLIPTPLPSETRPQSTPVSR